jgi:uncharacterized membrane protein affecting hemolysin expression
MRVTKTSVIADVMTAVVVILCGYLVVNVMMLADVMVAQHQLQVAMLVAPLSLATQGTRRRRTHVRNAQWESFHLHLA